MSGVYETARFGWAYTWWAQIGGGKQSNAGVGVGYQYHCVNHKLWQIMEYKVASTLGGTVDE